MQLGLHTIRIVYFKHYSFSLFKQIVFSSTGSVHTRMGIKKFAFVLLVLCLCLEGGSAKEKGTKKGKKKGKQVYCPS